MMESPMHRPIFLGSLTRENPDAKFSKAMLKGPQTLFLTFSLNESPAKKSREGILMIRRFIHVRVLAMLTRRMPTIRRRLSFSMPLPMVSSVSLFRW